MTTRDASTEAFDVARPRLQRIAYRMLGSVADAEDVVQEAFLRWRGADQAEVREPQAWLARTVTRLCLDVLKSARKRREVYVGPWLPEPVVEPEQDSLDVDDITLPLMLALERLSPLERAAFLLHDAFGLPFEEVGDAIGRDAAACRQLASRARSHVRSERPRYATSAERGHQIAEAFFTASRTGDLTRLRSMLSEDVTLYADGGGVRPAALRVITGLEDVMKVQGAVARNIQQHGAGEMIRFGLINGLPGFVTREADGLLQTTAVLVEEGRIEAIYVVRNPEKLRHLEG
jgi:RNA polymerase sigma-70 factor (ECF subfamily)